MKPRAHADLEELIALFYRDARELGHFQPAVAPLPTGYNELLNHQHHMTVTVEEYFQQLVNVEVLAAAAQDDHYWRKIRLRGSRDGVIVMFGIVRLNLGLLANDVRQEIEGQGKPLGRVLIEHNVLREVELLRLWHVQLGPDLATCLETTAPSTYGRTALIHCDGQPAVELLEIVKPLAPREQGAP